MQGEYRVYYLSSGFDIFYVGYTKQSLGERLRGHKSATKNGKCSNGIKNKKIRKYWGSLEIHEVERLNGTRDEALDLERKWVNKLKKAGNIICNASVVPICERVIDETGYKNIRISDAAFEKIKSFVDRKGLKLGRFVEDAAIEKLQKDKK